MAKAEFGEVFIANRSWSRPLSDAPAASQKEMDLVGAPGWSHLSLPRALKTFTENDLVGVPTTQTIRLPPLPRFGHEDERHRKSFIRVLRGRSPPARTLVDFQLAAGAQTA